MKRVRVWAMLGVAVAAIATIAHAADVFEMKCGAKPQKDPRTGQVSKPCGFTTPVTLGGGMFFDQAMGYCKACKKLVSVNWTREGIPEEMKGNIKVKPRPEPIGEVWDGNTGRTLTIHACPQCKGPFAVIKTLDDIKHCPSCNQPHFAVDESKPRIAVD